MSSQEYTHYHAVRTSLAMKLSTLRVIRVNFREDQRWLDFLSIHPDASVYHHPGYLAALEEEYGRKCIALACETADGKLESILPLLSTRGFPLKLSRNILGPRLSSLPRTPIAGPLALNQEALKLILEAAVDLVRFDGKWQLEIKSFDDSLDQLMPDLYKIRWRDTYLRGLPNNPEPESALSADVNRDCKGQCDNCREMSFGGSRGKHKISWATTRAVKEGVRVRVAECPIDLRKWYPLYLNVMRKSMVPPHPLRFFQSLWNHLGPIGSMSLSVAEIPNITLISTNQDDHASHNRAVSTQTFEGKPVGGSILLQFGRKAFWAFTGSNSTGMRSHANDLALLKCIREACREGYDYFDLGEVADDHPKLSQFKAKWGTIQQPIYRYYYPAPELGAKETPASGRELIRNAAGFVWKRLPLPLIATLGEWLNGYL